MTRYATFFVVLLIALAASVQAAQADQQIVLSVDNMVCMSCEMQIENAVTAVDGVTSVKADAESKTVRVSFDQQRTSVETILAASSEAGYPAEVVTAR
ncbi:MAG: heavy-metal-associated domain-containing protein [Wenzhouxiangella sp.]